MNRINKPDKATVHDIDSLECPHCGALLDKSVGAEHPNQRKPRPGDRSICLHCANPAKLDENMKMVKLTDEEMKEAMSDSRVTKFMAMAKDIKAEAGLGRSEEYSKQLEKMAEQVMDWIKTNPGFSPSIQYNFQAKVAVIASLEDAINNNFISINEDATKMFTDLGWLEDKPTMPTILMIRAVMEHVFKEEE